MSIHRASVTWVRGPSEVFTDLKYQRAHTWHFDGGVVVPASSAVTSVPLPYSKAENVDPEEAFVAALSSCHMLTFLYLAAKAGLAVNLYRDNAEGLMQRDDRGKQAITRVTLRPAIVLRVGSQVTDAQIQRLHHAAHEECYIASSVRTQLVIEGGWSLAV